MTKEEILDYFKDINHAYNDSMQYDTLKRMLDELAEPCEDCISRQAVRHILNHEVKMPIKVWKKLFELVDCLPCVNPQPKTEWIPVIERLPENHDDVLVWFEYIKDDYDCAWWGLAYYSLQYKKWVVSTNGRNPIVKAWMPLPEPYKTEKE